MKYILILLTTMLFGCSDYAPVIHGECNIIKIVIYKGANYANYKLHNQENIKAPIGLYNVGDTVWFTKK